MHFQLTTLLMQKAPACNGRERNNFSRCSLILEIVLLQATVTMVPTPREWLPLSGVIILPIMQDHRGTSFPLSNLLLFLMLPYHRSYYNRWFLFHRKGRHNSLPFFYRALLTRDLNNAPMFIGYHPSLPQQAPSCSFSPAAPSVGLTRYQDSRLQYGVTKPRPREPAFNIQP